MPASPPLDLTGQVRKTQAYYFANGGVADIWMGEWLQDNTQKIVQYFPFLLAFNTDWHGQVAVKVMRDVCSNADYFEWLKIVSGTAAL